MAPPIPTQCDACSKPLSTPTLICSRCKAYAYCGPECQGSHWTAFHKFGCSALPKGELVPAKVEWSEERASEVDRAARLVKDLVASFQEWRNGDLVARMGLTWEESVRIFNFSGAQSLPVLSNLAYSDLITYRLPSKLASPPLPRRSSDVNLAIHHSLALIARLYLLHDLSEITPHYRDHLFDPDKAACNDACIARHHGPPAGWKARLHGPKVLAKPDGLSVNEYLELITRLASMIAHAEEVGSARRRRWLDLGAAGAVVLA